MNFIITKIFWFSVAACVVSGIFNRIFAKIYLRKTVKLFWNDNLICNNEFWFINRISIFYSVNGATNDVSKPDTAKKTGDRAVKGILTNF